MDRRTLLTAAALTTAAVPAVSVLGAGSASAAQGIAGPAQVAQRATPSVLTRSFFTGTRSIRLGAARARVVGVKDLAAAPGAETTFTAVLETRARGTAEQGLQLLHAAGVDPTAVFVVPGEVVGGYQRWTVTVDAR